MTAPACGGLTRCSGPTESPRSDGGGNDPQRLLIFEELPTNPKDLGSGASTVET